MTVFTLTPHPITPCDFIESVTARISVISQKMLELSYVAIGDIERLAVPPPRQAARGDELWRHTCFEAFLRLPDSTAYHEFNFSPSGEWAAYAFDAYRSGMKNLQTAAPDVVWRQTPQRLEATVRLPVTDAWQPRSAALTAVLRDKEGRVSYWSLAHPDGKPDFHHAKGFISL